MRAAISGRFMLAASVATIALTAAVPVSAQSGGSNAQGANSGDDERLGEIIVTSRRVEENLQNTPISVTAVTGEDLRELGATNLSSLDRIAPNVTYTTNGGSSLFAGMGSNPAIFIRGIGQTDFVIGSDPGVGTYLDGVFIARSFGGNLENLDIERVEVLRGPQGTLFGKNSEGGALNLISKRPGDAFEGYVDASYGSRNRVDIQGAATLPLADGLSARAAFMSRTQDGYIHNDYLDKDVANTNVQAGRLTLRYHPDSQLDIVLTGEMLHQRQRGQQLTLLDVRTPVNGDVNDFGTYNTFYNRAIAPLRGYELMGNQWVADPRHTNSGTIYDDNADVYGTTLNVSYNLGDVTLKSITAYRDVKATFGGDMDYSPARFWENYVDTKQNQFSQEFQVSGSVLDDRLQFTGGLFYFHEKAGDNQIAGYLIDAVHTLYDAAPHSIPAPGRESLTCPNIDPVVNNSLCLGGNLTNAPEAVAAAIALQLGNPNYSTRRQVNNTYAAYGQFTYHITDEFEFTGGLRYSDDGKKAEYHDITYDAVTPDHPATTDVAGDQKARMWTYTATLGYHVSPDVYLYATHSSGYKAGGIVSRVFQGQVRLPAYQPEKNYNYELGFKTEFLDHRVRLNGAVFRNWYDNIQYGYFRIIGGLLEAYIANPADAELYGGELEMTALVSDRLTLNASAGLTSIKYKNVQPEAPTVLNYDNARPENVPKAKLNGGFTYRQPLGDAGDLSLRFDYAWQSSVVLIDYFQIAPAERNRVVQPSYGIGTLHVSYSPTGRNWEAYVHVDNLFDKLAETSHWDYNGITAGLYNRPREVRAGVRLNF